MPSPFLFLCGSALVALSVAQTPPGFIGEATGHLGLNNFGPYPLGDPQNVTGYVLLSWDAELLTINYKLMGIDKECTTRDESLMNSCGLHIHTGFTCSSDYLVGNHYWNEAKMSDPWLNGDSWYMVSDPVNGIAKGQVKIDYGYGVDPSKGHAFIVHDRKGNRMACGVLPVTTDKVSLGHIAPYPEYSGPLMTKGHITMDFRGVSVGIAYNMTGVDPRCAKPAPLQKKNSCGLHIHMGETCTNMTGVGDHYWDPTYKPSTNEGIGFVDPWLQASFLGTAEGVAIGMLQVEYGYNFSTSKGRAVVVHDWDGNRTACVLIPSLADRETAPLPALARFTGYMGPAVGGSVKLDFRGGGVKILYNLTGTDPMCNGVPGDMLNSCGIHIHSSIQHCEAPGSHYYNAMTFKTDPWAVAIYKTQPMESSLIVSYGYSFDDTKGRTVVVHDYNGTKVACAVIPATSNAEAMVTGFMPVATASAIEAASTVMFDWRTGSVRINYNLLGADPECTMKGDMVNSCGLHIHQGTSCSDFGEHYYDMEKFQMDPWQASYYTVKGETAMGSLDVEYGYGWAQSKGHAVVIHNYAGAPVACATLPMDSAYTTDSAGVVHLTPIAPVAPAGTVVLAVSGLGVKMTYSLMDVEPMCAAAGPNPLSCGLHIHKGFSCDNPSTHYYNNMSFPVDPWMYASYVADGNMATGSVVVSYGENWAYTEGRTLVVHNYAGEKVACSVIPQTTDQVMATDFKKIDPVFPLMTMGKVTLDFRVNSVMMAYNLTGTDSECSRPGPAPNSCGLHIHAGMSCDNQNSTGGHYWDMATIGADPWAMVTYMTDGRGNAMGMVNVEFGYGYAMSKGHALVIHDYNGVKVACALIPMQKADNAEMMVKIESVSKYPSYSGPYDVTVESASITFNGVGAHLVYNLSGVPCECAQRGPAPNSCGLHIHIGSSCMDATQIGGHWFNNMTIAYDPWAVAPYTTGSCADGMETGTTNAFGALTVDFGYGATETLSKVLVLHDYLGNRIACTPLGGGEQPPSRDLDMTGVLLVPALGRYPDAEMFPNATGVAQLHHQGGQVSILYRFSGVDPTCTTKGDAMNSCGMHIHAGFSCATALAIKGHYYNLTKGLGDPWQASWYEATPEGTAQGTMNVFYGHSIDETKGRTFVLHDRDGHPFTCAVLGSTTDRVTLGTPQLMEGYNAVATKVNPMGMINFDFKGNNVDITYNLTGLDSRCTMINPEAENSCGLHIHAGTSCENITMAGHHYFDPYQSPADDEPWKKVFYQSDEQGNAMMMMPQTVEYGYGFDTTKGHAVVMHDYAGAMMTCNLLPVFPDRDVTELPAITKIPGYDGDVNIGGTVKLDFRGRGVKITYNLTGVEPSCAMPGMAPNSCGIHIHAGFSCAEPGVHYYNATLYPTDPWSYAPYTPTMPGSLIVSYGYDWDHSKGRVVVVHNYDGVKVACAVIPETTDHATATNFQKIGQAGVQLMGSAELDFRATNVRISYDLMGVDARCEAPKPDTTNSCGIHIHEGMSCDAPGGHYWNKNLFPMDPWAMTTYMSMEEEARGVVNVEFGYGYAMSKGHAFVIHNYDGIAVSCAIISTGSAPRDTVGVVSFMSLTGTPTVDGKVLMDYRGMGVKLSYNLTNVDPMCSSPGPEPLSCGIHIHQGFNCSAPGTHYFNNMTYPIDPWMYTTYTASGPIAQGSVVVSYGYDYNHTQGRTLVIHNYAGAKVACQVIPEMSDYVVANQFVPAPGAPLQTNPVSGAVDLHFRVTSVRMNYQLRNTDSRCVMHNPETQNSCGIHIHQGTCASIGGHWFNAATVGADPWGMVYYVSNNEGETSGVLNVENGYGYAETTGKVVVLHDWDGIKIACAPIPAMLSAQSSYVMSTSMKYPAYAGPFSPKLQANLHFNNEAVTISYNLSGVPCECSQIGTAINSCGLHIHMGTSCSTNEAVGAHWFEPTMTNNVDPWSFTPYTADKCSEGGSSASGSLTVVDGKDMSSSMERVLVVHDYWGTRIGCVPMNMSPNTATENSVATLFQKYLPYIIGGAGGVLLLLLLIVYCRHRRAQRARAGTLNEKLVKSAGKTTGPDRGPTRRTVSVQH